MLPGMNGFEICKQLRTEKVKTPILMLTGKGDEIDKVMGLELGADDYVTKPFAFIELRSRIHALLRRSNGATSPQLTIQDLVVDPMKHTVTRSGQKIILTPKEFSIIELLLRHKDEVVTRTMITEHVWDYNFEGMSNVVDVFVGSLRRKIDKPSFHTLIYTIHGVGYKMSETP